MIPRTAVVRRSGTTLWPPARYRQAGPGPVSVSGSSTCRRVTHSRPRAGRSTCLPAPTTQNEYSASFLTTACRESSRSSFFVARWPCICRNAKYAPRGTSGKLAAIYPTDDTSCEHTLAELDSLIDGEHGPYILSDLRYGDGPLYVRYGSFSERYCRNADGEVVPAIEDGTGQLVPDLRTPVFAFPEWVTLPPFLSPHLAARNAVTIKDLPYQIDQALHFSNGGGVYAGTDSRTGEPVVLKEARPYAGLAADGSDAVARLRREHDILRQLSGLGVVPGVHGYFEAGGHHFLVEDHIDGLPLNSLYARGIP